jgi:alkaline phosphatase D
MSRPRYLDPSRRALLSGAAAAWAASSLSRALAAKARSAGTSPGPERSSTFTLGVASGDPTPDGFVLWTRLAPDPLHGGGMPPEAFVVGWQVATDESMTKIVRDGNTIATPALAHSVHVEVGGLESGRPYWYRFQAGGDVSPIGRTRTAPDRHAPVNRLSFATTSCQHWQSGLYTGYQHLGSEDLEFVVHLGDYIYEGGVEVRAVRPHSGPEVKTLEDYRNRYALYKTDPLLQAAHAAFPWIVIWDDHEVIDNYSGAFDRYSDDPRKFLRRRAAAYQAFYEHLPLRLSSAPNGPDMLLYRRLGFGDLLDLHLLDTRQYRSLAPTRFVRGPRISADLPENRAASLLGQRQEAWLQDGLQSSRACWNALAQGIFMAQRLYPSPSESGVPLCSPDKWDGYPAARRRLTRLFSERRTPNPFVLTGDDHRTWIADLKENFDDSRSGAVASEFVGAAISSSGDGSEVSPGSQAILAANPHLKYHHGWRGYLRFRLDHRRLHADVRVMPYVSRPGAPIVTSATFTIEAGRPGVQRA